VEAFKNERKIINLLQDETDNKRQILLQEQETAIQEMPPKSRVKYNKKDFGSVFFTSADLFRFQPEISETMFQGPDIHWWDKDITICMSIQEDGKLRKNVGIFDMQIKGFENDTVLTKKVLTKKLSISNVVVDKDAQGQRLSRYMVWYGIQLAKYINTYTPHRTQELSRSDQYTNYADIPISAVFLRTASGKTHKGMRQAAESNSMTEIKDSVSPFWDSEWSIDIAPKPPGATTLTGIERDRPLIIHGTPFQDDISITDTDKDSGLYLEAVK